MDSCPDERVHRTNAEGLAGLANRRSPGASLRLAPEQKAELAALVEAGPDVQRRRGCALAARRSSGADQGVVRRGDARTPIRQLPGGNQLAALGFRRLSVRPRHPKTDEGAQEAFKKTSRRR